MEFPEGLIVNFEMIAFSAEVERTIHVSGTRGEIKGNAESHEIALTEYGKEPVRISTIEGDIIRHEGGEIGSLLLFSQRFVQVGIMMLWTAVSRCYRRGELRTSVDRSI